MKLKVEFSHKVNSCDTFTTTESGNTYAVVTDDPDSNFWSIGEEAKKISKRVLNSYIQEEM